MNYNFYKTYEGDAVFYWYDITSHIQRVFGEDIVEKACVCLGQGYNDDSEDEIERLESKLECEVKEMERKLNGTYSFFFDYNQDVCICFKNGKILNFSSGEGYVIKTLTNPYALAYRVRG